MNGHFTIFGNTSRWDTQPFKPPMDPGSIPNPKSFYDPISPIITLFELSHYQPYAQFINPAEHGFESAQPFVLAMPHHSMAWTQMFGDPNEPSTKKQQNETMIKQLDLVKEQMHQQLQQIDNYKNKLHDELKNLDETKK